MLSTFRGASVYILKQHRKLGQGLEEVYEEVSLLRTSSLHE